MKMVITRSATFLAYTLLCLRSTFVASFAFSIPTPRTRSAPSLVATTTTKGPAQRRATGPSSAQHTTRNYWARTARGGGNDEEKPYIPGSGLRGIDTSNLTGTDKRDADWFERTAEREARGQLQLFEDPIVYIALLALAPVVIGIWGVLNCYIPGFCPPI